MPKISELKYVKKKAKPLLNKNKVSVLFVCLGNICRSPTAEAVFRALVKKAGLEESIFIDSAGTANYHAGGSPDKRAMSFAEQRNYDLSKLRARQLTVSDFSTFNYILAMDIENLNNIHRIQPKDHRATVELMLSYSANNHKSNDVPDPYYGGDEGFNDVLDLLEDACQGLLETIVAQHS